MSPRGADAPRTVAYRALAAVTQDDAYANLVLPRLLAEADMEHRDAAFATELAYGTSRYRGTLDAIVSAAAGRDVNGFDNAVQDVLRLGAYQMLLTRVPVHAAVDTSVRLVTTVHGRKTSGLVNAVLRRVGRHDFDGWIDKLSTGDATRDLALRTAHPEWIVRGFDAALGGDPAELNAALEADNRAPRVQLCARPGLIDRDALAEATGGTPGRYGEFAVDIPGGDPADIAAVREGNAHVQDEGSQLVATAVARAPIAGSDRHWLDLCAGPGGKAALWGALALTRAAEVTAVEVAPHRATLVERATRGLPVTVHRADGREFGGDGEYDRVLVDAPCSGLGALRRRPEARWRRDSEDLPGLRRLQTELLNAALRLVRPGGVVGYVTCSPELTETRDIVATVDGHRVDVRAELPSDLPALGDGPTAQLWPHRHGTDAMFCAILRRR